MALQISKETNMYEYWFANVRGISNQRKIQLRQSVKKIEELYYIEETSLRQLLSLSDKEQSIMLQSKEMWHLEQEYEKLLSKKVTFLIFQNINYPKKLTQIENPPYAIYIKGQLPKEEGLSIAIVGARQCTPYGRFYAREFAMELSRIGIQIISGMAKGIDGISQRATLDVGGYTCGILAGGVDNCYPREHIGLYMDLIQRGGIISEQNIGIPPIASYFPARNRIISALSDIVLIVEAKEKSGSLITADMALEQGKEVYALPGPINSSLSQGCNRLILQGANVLLSPEELLKDLNLNCAQKVKYLAENKIKLESAENMVYSCLDLHPRNLNEIMQVVKLPITEILSILISLELQGLIEEISKNHYVKINH
ncbi:DNA-processing protein DprA [Lachnospiraceae bacterium LCP25S3_G4]